MGCISYDCSHAIINCDYLDKDVNRMKLLTLQPEYIMEMQPPLSLSLSLLLSLSLSLSLSLTYTHTHIIIYTHKHTFLYQHYMSKGTKYMHSHIYYGHNLPPT